MPIHLATLLLSNAGGAGTFGVTGGSVVFLDPVTSDFGENPLTTPDGILTATIPEPGTLLLLATGLTGLAIQGRRRES